MQDSGPQLLPTTQHQVSDCVHSYTVHCVYCCTLTVVRYCLHALLTEANCCMHESLLTTTFILVSLQQQTQSRRDDDAEYVSQHELQHSVQVRSLLLELKLRC